MNRKPIVESKKKTDQTKHRDRANRAAVMNTDQIAKIQGDWASAELLELIEAVPHHEYFIHNSEEVMPRG